MPSGGFDAIDDPRQLERGSRVLHPGEWGVETDVPLSTLLGSCVAVCLFDARAGVGGMNHFLLPNRASRPDDDPDVVLAGDWAMEILVNDMLARGARKARLVAKAFGGGDITQALQRSIGQRNAQFARDWLRQEGIVLAAEDFGGPCSRKVVFDPRNGDAYCRRQSVQSSLALQVAREEAHYAAKLQKGTVVRSVELF